MTGAASVGAGLAAARDARPIREGERIHATLHVPLRKVVELLTVDRVRQTIALADRALLPLTGGRRPRVAVAGLRGEHGEHERQGKDEQHEEWLEHGRSGC